MANDNFLREVAAMYNQIVGQDKNIKVDKIKKLFKNMFKEYGLDNAEMESIAGRICLFMDELYRKEQGTMPPFKYNEVYDHSANIIDLNQETTSGVNGLYRLIVSGSVLDLGDIVFNGRQISIELNLTTKCLLISIISEKKQSGHSEDSYSHYIFPQYQDIDIGHPCMVEERRVNSKGKPYIKKVFRLIDIGAPAEDSLLNLITIGRYGL